MKQVFASSVLLLSLGAVPAGAQVEHESGDHPFFIPNRGELPASVRFYSRTERMAAQFADRGMSLATPTGEVRVAFMGADPGSTVRSARNTLFYAGTWPGIETRYAPYRQTLKSEYHVAPGADPTLIRLRYDGSNVPLIMGDGSLMISAAGAEFLESPPYAYQDQQGRVRIQAAWYVYRDGTVGVKVGPYDPSRLLIIDPVMNYSTLFGGSGDTSVTSVAFDLYGNAVVAGWTTATDLPAHGAKTKNSGGVDAFVAKLSAEGNQIVWCTYLGGSGDDRAFGVAVDNSNNVYVTGWTQSTNFPVAGAIQTKLVGGRDAFVAKLNSSGTTIVYSTYLGGNNYDQGNSIAVDSTGAAYVTGDTSSTNFPVVNAYQAASGGQQDAFVAKLNPAGNVLVFSTYLGGNAVDHGAGIALDAVHNVYVTGSTYSSNFPVYNATQPRIGGGEDAFVAELSSSGNVLLFGTYIGGSGGTPGLEECGNAVAVDVSGNLYVAGVTSSINFPTTAGAYQATLTYGGAEDHGFAWKINSSKTQIIYSTYLAGMNMDVVNGLAVDPAGNAYLVGSTSSTDFPIVRAFQPAITGLTNAFILKLNPTGSGLIFGSFLGGSNSDTANGIAVDSKQNIVIGGLAQSVDFPLQNAAQSYANAPFSGFVTRVVSGWYPITFLKGIWSLDTWHDAGSDGTSGTLTTNSFGQAGDIPIVGDWTGSGNTKIGVFRCTSGGGPNSCLWILDSNGNGRIDSGDCQFNWGNPGDIPVVGNWDGSGYLRAGLFRGGYWILDMSGHMSGCVAPTTTGTEYKFYFGSPTNVPVVGDWQSTGVTHVGIVRNTNGSLFWDLDYTSNAASGHSLGTTLQYGQAGDTPLVGDWDGSGTVKIGVSRGGNWILNVQGNHQYQAGIDMQFWFGNSSYLFVVGH